MLLLIIALQAAAAGTGAQSDQDRVTATEIFAYAQWRNCVLHETHHKAASSHDPATVADAAIAACGTREANYRSSLTALAQLYQLKDPADFARRTTDQGRKALEDLAVKELR